MNSFVELALIKSNYASFVVVVSFFSSKRISPEEDERKGRGKKRNQNFEISTPRISLLFGHFLKLDGKFVSLSSKWSSEVIGGKVDFRFSRGEAAGCLVDVGFARIRF